MTKKDSLYLFGNKLYKWYHFGVSTSIKVQAFDMKLEAWLDCLRYLCLLIIDRLIISLMLLSTSLRLQSEATKPIEVGLASGERLLICDRMINDVKLLVQGVRIIENFYVLPLVGHDAVLGGTWMSSVGKILIDHSTITMEFELDGEKRMWKTLPTTSGESSEINMVELMHILEDKNVIKEEKN